MNTFMHGPRFFSFHFLSFSISFPKLTILTILRLYMACKMWKITALTWEISSWRMVEKFDISPFPCITLHLIGFESMKLENKIKNIWFESRNEKGRKNKHKKTWMKWNDAKWTIWYFQQCACVNAIYIASAVTTTYRMKNNKSSTRGLSLEMSALARARAQFLNMLHIRTHLSVPHGENI